MSHRDDINRLILNHSRRLQKLKAQQALEGFSVEPKILLEIETIEAEIEKLQTELKAIEASGVVERPPMEKNTPNEEQKYDIKYNLKNATLYHSAVGDFAHVNNYISTQAAATDPGIAELKTLFEEVNRRLAGLEEADRALVAPAVEQTVAAATAIQQGDESAEKQSFLEARLKTLYLMRKDIGEVIITTLASPPAGIALTLQKVGQKVKEALK